MPASSFSSASFPPQDASQREQLLADIRGASLVYGPWQGFKALYKEVETAFANGRREPEILAALMARFDGAAFADEKKATGAPPVVRGRFDAIHIENGLLYAVESNENLLVFDLSAPLEPREIFRWKPSASNYSYYPRMWIEGQRLIFGSAQRLHVFDLSDPRAPKFRFECAPGNANGLAVMGERIFVSDYQNLRVLSLPASGAALTELGSVPFQYAYNLTARADLVAVSHYGGRNYQIVFFDVSDPAAPREVSKFNANNPNGWQFWNDFLVRTEGDSLVLTDVSRPEKPREISRLKVAGAQRFHIAGNTIYLACSSWRQRDGYEHKVRIIDASQPHNLRLIGECEASAQQMVWHDGLLYLSASGYLDIHGLKILDVSEPSRPQPVGQRPKNATFGYLKRRARRLLRTLALADSDADNDAFVAVSSALLQEAGSGHDALDLGCQWVSAELTLGGGARWHQSSHGRGAYVKSAGLVIKNREERAPLAWNRHLDAAQKLWQHPHLPWQTQEMARKILLANRAEVSAPSVAQLARFLWSNSPALLNFAAREARLRLSELENSSLAPRTAPHIAPRVLAPLLWVSNASQRRDILSWLQANPRFATATATLLATLLGQNSATGLARRGRDISLLLAARFDLSDPDFEADGAFEALPALLSSAEAPIRALGLDFCRRLSAPRALDALRFMAEVAPPFRENFVAALCEGASRGELSAEAIDKAVRLPDLATRDAAWRIIAASQTPAEIFRAMWTKLLTGLKRDSLWSGGSAYRGSFLGYRWLVSGPLQSAIASDAALLTLGRCDLQSTSITPKFGPVLYNGAPQSQISPTIWGAFSLFIPAAQVVETVIAAPNWTAWRDAWVRANAPHPAKLAAFWNAVQDFLSESKDEAKKQLLRARTFEQSIVAATFGGAASQLSPALLMSLIGAIPDNLWATWRASLLQTLQTDAATRDAFWSAARESPALESGFLRARLIEDPDFAATFGLLETDALEADNPAFTPLLLAWLQAREADLGRAGWLEAATHPLSDVRDLGLSHLEILGLDVPGALQLLESRLPPSIAFGRNWFENQGENQLNLALALSDSPQPGVRAFGREFIAARLEILMNGGLIAYLQDNPNAEMQAFVAAQLREKPELAAPEFDRAVLRSRYRARHAKTLVQERRTSSAPLPDDKTLLELARGRTARDREWAMSQLARRALDGNAVEGVEVGNLAAI